jgi:hypothetical protein
MFGLVLKLIAGGHADAAFAARRNARSGSPSEEPPEKLFAGRDRKCRWNWRTPGEVPGRRALMDLTRGSKQLRVSRNVVRRKRAAQRASSDDRATAHTAITGRAHPTRHGSEWDMTRRLLITPVTR